MVPLKINSKSVTGAIQLLLEIKVKKKVQNSQNILGVEKNSIDYDLNWSITWKTHPFTGGNRKSNLCLTRKLAIMKADPKSLSNTRDELSLNADI